MTTNICPSAAAIIRYRELTDVRELLRGTGLIHTT
jgi:hypothetical protein